MNIKKKLIRVVSETTALLALYISVFAFIKGDLQVFDWHTSARFWVLMLTAASEIVVILSSDYD